MRDRKGDDDDGKTVVDDQSFLLSISISCVPMPANAHAYNGNLLPPHFAQSSIPIMRALGICFETSRVVLKAKKG